MTFKRRALSALSKAELLKLGRELELNVTSRMSVEDLLDRIAISKRARLEKLITTALSRVTLKAVCDACGLKSDGKEKTSLVGRILEAAAGKSGSTEDNVDALLADDGDVDTALSASERFNDGLTTHTFQLRRDLRLRFSLPSDLTAGEAQRLADFMKTLVIGDHETKSSAVELKPSDTSRSGSKRSRVGLGSSNKPPRGARLSLPAGVAVRGPLSGGGNSGERIGSGHGYVDVSLRLSGRAEEATVIFPAGLVLISKSTQTQNGILVQPVRLIVPAQVDKEWTLAMYCANKARKPADASAEFTIGPVLDEPGLQELFALLDSVQISSDKTETVQKAVWEITDGDGLTLESRTELQSLRRS